jgi:hypothetical protein
VDAATGESGNLGFYRLCRDGGRGFVIARKPIGGLGHSRAFGGVGDRTLADRYEQNC